MKIQISTKHYDFTITSERETGGDISDLFSRVASIVAELQTAAEKAEAVVVNHTAVEGLEANPGREAE